MDTDIPTTENLLKLREKRRRRLRFIAISCLFIIPILTYLETKVFPLGKIDFPLSGNVLVFILINFNVLLLLLMVFLVLRNLAELLFERKEQALGSKLRTKLVVSFVSLSLIPTGLLFFISLQFVSTSMDYWFNINVEKSLEESLHIARSLYDDARSRVKLLGEVVHSRLREISVEAEGGDEQLLLLLDEMINDYDLAGLQVVTDQRLSLNESFASGLMKNDIPKLPSELIRKAFEGEENLISIQAVNMGELVRSVIPVEFSRKEGSGENSDGARKYALITSLLIDSGRLEEMNIVTRGVEGYRQLKLLKKPIKTSLLVMLLIVTLLIIFCAVWFAFYVSRSLTGPIGKLAEATKKVAEGELDFFIEKESSDEMGLLVESFNVMTRDLLISQIQLEEANVTLQDRNLELNRRRNYTETILQNITAGVISLDNEGKITTINRYAEVLLGLRTAEVIHRRYNSILHSQHLDILENYLKELEESGKSSIQRPLRLTVDNDVYSLRVNFVRLEDENDNQLGIVIVFDDLTELEKAQRMAAWREVARRIAHEVKNPLTPIQLSAQRLRKRYLKKLGKEGEIFDLCTDTIINQVEELKGLVSEFSNFARMPMVQRSLHDLVKMAQDVLVLYKEAHKNITFTLSENQTLPLFLFDLEQMKRVLINLLDNAVAATGENGVIEVELSMDEEKKLAFLEVRDNGTGVTDDIKRHLFEPYFSTKKSGTGLGLAIASTVVADHGGYIRIKDRVPQGACFIIELPLSE